MKKMYEESNIQDIANAIREKNGSTDTYKPSEMASAIREIEVGGSDSYYDTFWDNYQDYGNRTDCSYMFYGQGWNDKTLKLKHRMKPKTLQYCFQYCRATDLTEVLSMFDTSECTNFGYFVSNSSVEIMPKINVKSATTLNALLYYASILRKIECIENVNKDQTFNNAFVVCSKLEEIDFTGEIGKTISFIHSSKLTSKSAKNVIRRLVNYLGTDNAFKNTISFSRGTWALLDAEGSNSPNGNTWREYIENIGWLTT